MRLKLIRVRGYKRFGAESRLDTRGPVVAVVGPNEAGKTSLLEAIEHVSSAAAFGAHEFTDRLPVEADTWLVAADFSLDDDDRAALGQLVPADMDLTYTRWRYAGGNAKYSVSPRMRRDMAHRTSAAAALRQALDDGWLERFDAPEDEDEEPVDDESRLFLRARALVDELDDRADWLDEDVRRRLSELASAIDEEVPEGADTDRSELARVLGLAAVAESEPPPQELISDILAPRVPAFLLFGDEQRELATEYVWGEHASPPSALGNLFALAKTDYGQFMLAATRNDRPTMEMLQEFANKELAEAFAAWRQSDLHVSFSADQASLHLHIRDHATAKRTRLDERSAGLRSFVALVAFTARYGDKVRPVLLVDEAETHLHYSAQADLVRVFERQCAAETIIYTTHSIGCLPSDLGATIRVVSPVEDEQYRSIIYNSFWAARPQAGLTPMMLAMGAGALAFTPSRRAVIAEGASEAILLPTLVREALTPEQRDETMGYQVAPGIAEVRPDDAADLEMEAGGVAYLIDSDAGGRGHERKLSERAKQEGRVVVLGDGQEEGLCIEDFVAADVLTEAFNRMLTRRDEGSGDQLAADELPSAGRGAYLDSWSRERGFRVKKAPLAQEALDVGRDRGALCEPARLPQMRELHERLVRATEATGQSDET
jgi:ABC-type transport system involved in cytochrome c biogenesis ATPase subunit